MAERHCRAQMRREVFRTLRINAKTMIRRWEKEFNEIAKMKRKTAHSGKNREVVKHAISQEVFEFIKGKDIFHDLIHPHNIEKENVPLIGGQNMPRPPQDFDMDSAIEPIAFDSLTEDMDSVLEPIVFNSLVEDMDSMLEPINSLTEDMDSMLEPIDSLTEGMDSMLEPITFDLLTEDMDSLLEPINSLTEDMDSLLEPITFDSLVEDMDSVLEPIAINNSSTVDEFNESVCRLDSLLEPVVLIERC